MTIVKEFLRLLILSFGIIMFVMCFILVFSKSTFMALSRLCNRSYSTRLMLKPFEIPRQVDFFAVFNVRAVFTLIFLCAIISLCLIFNSFRADVLAGVFAENNIHVAGAYQVFFKTMLSFLVLSLLCIILVSLSAIFNPQSFERLNQKMSFWISTRKGYKPLDISRNIDETLFNYRVHIGILGLFVSMALMLTAYFTL